MPVVPSKESKLELRMQEKRSKQEATALTQLSANILEILAGGEKSVS
jgi:U3 small nucleolar ribonucleoprotein component